MKRLVWNSLVENVFRYVYPQGGSGPAEGRSGERLYAWCAHGPAVRDAKGVVVTLHCKYDTTQAPVLDAALIARLLCLAAPRVRVETGDDVVKVHIDVALGAQLGSSGVAAAAKAVERKVVADWSKGKGGVAFADVAGVSDIRMGCYASSAGSVPWRLPASRRQHASCGPSLPYEELASLRAQGEHFLSEVYFCGRRSDTAHCPGPPLPAHKGDPAPRTACRARATAAELSRLQTEQNPLAESALRYVSVTLSPPPSQFSTYTPPFFSFSVVEIAYLIELAAKRQGINVAHDSKGTLSLPQNESQRPEHGHESLKAHPGSSASTVAQATSETYATLSGTLAGREHLQDGWRHLEEVYCRMSEAERVRADRMRQGLFSCIGDVVTQERQRRISALRVAAPQALNRMSNPGVRLDKTLTMGRQLAYHTTALTGGEVMEPLTRPSDSAAQTRHLHKSVLKVTSVSGPKCPTSDVSLNVCLIRPTPPTRKPFLAAWDPLCCVRGKERSSEIMGITNYHKTLR